MRLCSDPWYGDGGSTPDLICLSHLRWDFVYQRPQHLMHRFARERRVFFVEEPVFDVDLARLDVSRRDDGVQVAVPHLPGGMAGDALEQALRASIDELLRRYDIRKFGLWYYTPMAWAFTDHLEPRVIVYDCMDELSLFKGAPAELGDRERALLRRADLVFTGGQSLYEAKQHQHGNIHPFPSSVDVAHFVRARTLEETAADQRQIPRPRIGFFGVIDERMDIGLLDAVARARPDWHLVMLGPVAKIDPEQLPKHPNIHYLGARPYEALPAYLAGWDVAMLPFARNDSTRFISPTKTPEYLAAGRPVVSTSIQDVVRPYGEQGLVHIADDPDAFVAAIEAAMAEDADLRATRVDAMLAATSWDRTWSRMNTLIVAAVEAREPLRIGSETFDRPGGLQGAAQPAATGVPGG